MAQGRITAKGVLPPEAAVDPVEMLTLAAGMTKHLGMGGGLPLDVEHIDKDGNRESVELKL